MAGGGFRVEPDRLRTGGRGLHDLSDEVRDSIGEPLAPPADSNVGFLSSQALIATADAWGTETGEFAAVLRTAGDKLTETAAEYDQADASGARDLQHILRGS